MNNQKPDNLRPVTFDNARIIWRNFSGNEKLYNDAGNRNFNLVLDEQTYLAMKADGWNVKKKEPREEGGEPLYHVEVTVSFRGKFPPKLVLVTSSGQTRLAVRPDGTIDADEINILDMVEIEKVDLILNPRWWEGQAGSGIKAYLKTIFVTQREDELEKRYAELEDEGHSYSGGPRFED
jgi:hypothetical protein